MLRAIDQRVSETGLVETIWNSWQRRRSTLRRAQCRNHRGIESPEALETRQVLTPITLQFDYSLDTAGYFNDPARRQLLELAGQTYTSRITDTLSAITPSGGNTWDAVVSDPSKDGNVEKRITNLTVPANTLIVYVAGRNSSTGELAVGGPGGWNANGDTNWLNLVGSRGQAGALLPTQTDSGIWGGALSFNMNFNNVYFGTDGNAVPADKIDFVSVTVHELGHMFGIGTAGSFSSKIVNNKFTGRLAAAAYSGGTDGVPTQPDGAHWAPTVAEDGQQAVMIPTAAFAKRINMTNVDLAALQDIGWRFGDRMYRAYNPNADFHFFTTNYSEFQNAVRVGWRDETVNQEGFAVAAPGTANTSPLYRMYNPNKGTHYYTLNAAERDSLVTKGWNYERDEGALFTSKQKGTYELFRLYNNNSGVHMFTTNEAYKNAVLAQFPGVWVQHQSVGFSYFALPDSSLTAVTAGGTGSTAPLYAGVSEADTAAFSSSEVASGDTSTSDVEHLPSLIVSPATAFSLATDLAAGPVDSSIATGDSSTTAAESTSVRSNLDESDSGDLLFALSPSATDVVFSDWTE